MSVLILCPDLGFRLQTFSENDVKRICRETVWLVNFARWLALWTNTLTLFLSKPVTALTNHSTIQGRKKVHISLSFKVLILSYFKTLPVKYRQVFHSRLFNFHATKPNYDTSWGCRNSFFVKHDRIEIIEKLHKESFICLCTLHITQKLIICKQYTTIEVQ